MRMMGAQCNIDASHLRRRQEQLRQLARLIVGIIITERDQDTERLGRLLRTNGAQTSHLWPNQRVADAEQQLRPEFVFIGFLTGAQQWIDDQMRWESRLSQ